MFRLLALHFQEALVVRNGPTFSNVARGPPLHSPAVPVHPAAGSTPVPSPAQRPPLHVCAQSRPRDDPGVPRPRGL
eukprot:5890297-Prymnesium_polylepis.1